MPYLYIFCKKTANNPYLVLKPLIKYSITLFILLTTGYTQVFAHLYRLDFSYSAIQQIKGVEYFQALVQATEKEDIYIEEEENRRISLKEYSRDIIYASFFYAHLQEYFFLHLKSYISLNKYFSRVSFFGSPNPVWCVLRL